MKIHAPLFRENRDFEFLNSIEKVRVAGELSLGRRKEERSSS